MRLSIPFHPPFRLRAPSPVLAVLVGIGALLGGFAPAQAQTAQDILRQAMERHQERLAGVENVTIRQEVMGLPPTTVYLEKEEVEGHPVLVERQVEALDVEVDPREAVGDLWGMPHLLHDEWTHRWELEGEGSVDGQATWKLVLTDFEGLETTDLAPEDEEHWELTHLEFEIDQERLVPLRSRMEVEVLQDGETRSSSIRSHFSDYREVDGYLHPFRTIMEMDMAGVGISPEEAEEARREMEAMRRQLEEIPEEQRQMMEQMMGEQMEQLEALLAGEGFEAELRVVELRVNAGPP